MLLFFDIDGTLFDDSRRLPESVLPAFQQASRNGHRLIVNTGRTLCNMDRRLDGMPLDGWVMGCGTRLIYRGETLRSMEYAPEQSLRLREVFLGLGIPTVYECDTGLYFDPEGAAHPAIAEFRAFAAAHGLEREVSEKDPEFRAVKMFCFSDSRDRIRRLEDAAAKAGMPYEGIDRGNEGWEMVPAGYSKGTGIDDFRRLLGAERNECYAFGDSRNDVPMFRHAGHSIAMGNAPEDVKKICSYVAPRPEEDGIAKAMKHFGLI